ncbi:MAG: aspartate--tRNA(Asn) ligase [Oscillospiraceae bacterium]
MKMVTGLQPLRAQTMDELYQLAKRADGHSITLRGMLHSVRDMRDFAFLVLRRSDGLLQCVYNKTDDEAERSLLRDENAVEVTGTLRLEPRANGGVELLVENITLLSAPEAELPVAIHKRTMNIALENEMNLRPITLRNHRARSVFKLQEGVVRGFRSFLEEQGFTEMFTPKIVAAGAEGGANIFRLEYFGRKAYLAQSPQFYKQMLVPVYGRVFEIAPVFRAEKHDTPRHLNEYISVDFEMGFIDSFYDIIEMEIGMLRSMLEVLDTYYSASLDVLGVKLPVITEIPCTPFAEAKERVAEKYGRPIRDPYDLEPEEERLISQIVLEEQGSEFVFVTHYPSKKRPFYAMDDPGNSKFTLSFDLLFRGMEITTGGQRIHDYGMQVEKMRAKGLDPADFESYLMLHKYGCPPHGGLGLGLERFLLKLLDEQNIRSTSMFPRDTGRLTP